MDRRTEVVKNPDGPAALLDGGTIYTSGALTSMHGFGSAVGSRAEGRAQLCTVGECGRFQLDRQGGDIRYRAGQRQHHQSGTGPLTFSAVSNQPWLAISSGSGTAPATIQIVPSTTGLAAGSYTGHVTLTGGGSSKIVTVSLSVTGPVPVPHTVALAWKIPAAGKAISDNMHRSNISGGLTPGWRVPSAKPHSLTTARNPEHLNYMS